MFRFEKFQHPLNLKPMVLNEDLDFFFLTVDYLDFMNISHHKISKIGTKN